MALNIAGIRQSAVVVNAFTVAKLTPLALFIILGLPHVSAGPLQPDMAVTWTQISTAALLLIFAYGGYEVIPVPAGEARDPKRAVPFAMITVDPHRRGRDDAGAGRRAGDAAGAGVVEDAAGRCGDGVPRRRGARS